MRVRRPFAVRPLVAIAAALVAVGCAARSKLPPEPSFIVTSRPEEQDPPAAPAPETRCVAPAMRARIEDCSSASEPTREEVYLAVEESYRALAVRPPTPPPEEPASQDWKGMREIERRALDPLPLIPEQERAVALLTSWVCRHPYDLPATFRLARLHFEHRRFEEAMLYFARVGDGPVEDDLSVEAFFRWLEAANVLGGRFSVTSCFDEMAEKVPPTRDRLCDFDVVARHPERTERCTLIGRVNYALDRLKIQCPRMDRL